MSEATTIATRSVVVEREFSCPPEKLWRALTQAPLIDEWLMANDFEPVVGHKFQLRGEANPQWNGVSDCEVLTVEPVKRLAYSWNASGAEAATGIKTVVTFTLTATKTGTHLRMEHAGFRADQENNYRGAGYGWQRFLAALEHVVGGLA
jgi:uncharacterized protein YndB with AHSA1/START domain